MSTEQFGKLKQAILAEQVLTLWLAGAISTSYCLESIYKGISPLSLYKSKGFADSDSETVWRNYQALNHKDS